jgi:hypothetical protein
VKAEEDRFKIWPTNVDRAAFREVMAPPPPVQHGALEHANARVVQAHAFFSREVAEFVDEADSPDDRRPGPPTPPCATRSPAPRCTGR